jgi:predicted small secreted protein
MKKKLSILFVILTLVSTMCLTGCSSTDGDGVDDTMDKDSITEDYDASYDEDSDGNMTDDSTVNNDDNYIGDREDTNLNDGVDKTE